jgi:hypothetical protein
MQTLSQSFEVLITRKVPFLTKILAWLLLFCVIMLLIFGIPFLPAKNSYASDEMKTAYFILTTSEFEKELIFIFGSCCLILFPLYIFLRFSRKAILSFTNDSIFIKGKKVEINIPVQTISKIYFIDTKSRGEKRLLLYVEQEKQKTTRVKLKNYLDAEEVFGQLAMYSGINFQFFDRDLRMESDD